MKRKTRGFTLVELTFVIVVMLILAAMVIGGASYIMNQARGQTVVDQARTIRVAVENYMGRRRITAPPGQGQGAGYTTAKLRTDMLSYMGTATSTYITNPYSGTDYEVLTIPVTGVTTATALAPGTGTHTSYDEAGDYPHADAAHRGQVYYFFNDVSMNPPGHFGLWNGTELQEFTYFAVQAFDDQGAPLVTVGR